MDTGIDGFERIPAARAAVHIPPAVPEGYRPLGQKTTVRHLCSVCWKAVEESDLTDREVHTEM